MRKLTPFICVLFFFCCESQQNPDWNDLPENDPNSEVELVISDVRNLNGFISDLRIGKNDWKEDEIFFDTLEFVSFSDDADYAIASFRTKKGVLVHLNSDQVLARACQNYQVEWKVGEFSEAGENEALYFKEDLISLTALNASYSLESQLRMFYKDYKLGKKDQIQKHLHNQVELLCSFNPGAYCSLGRDFGLYKPEPIIEPYLITSNMPTGDACEGYEGASNGLYYQFIEKSNLPSFNDMARDGESFKPALDSKINAKGFAKVLVMSNEYSSVNLYFFNANDHWYFWIDDLCDCSA